MERFKVGIIGAGHIARKMAHTLRDMEGVEPYAVASRNQENAEGFACEWGFTRAYGSRSTVDLYRHPAFPPF